MSPAKITDQVVGSNQGAQVSVPQQNEQSGVGRPNGGLHTTPAQNPLGLARYTRSIMAQFYPRVHGTKTQEHRSRRYLEKCVLDGVLEMVRL